MATRETILCNIAFRFFFRCSSGFGNFRKHVHISFNMDRFSWFWCCVRVFDCLVPHVAFVQYLYSSIELKGIKMNNKKKKKKHLQHQVHGCFSGLSYLLRFFFFFFNIIFIRWKSTCSRRLLFWLHECQPHLLEICLDCSHHLPKKTAEFESIIRRLNEMSILPNSPQLASTDEMLNLLFNMN